MIVTIPESQGFWNISFSTPKSRMWKGQSCYSMNSVPLLLLGIAEVAWGYNETIGSHGGSRLFKLRAGHQCT